MPRVLVLEDELLVATRVREGLARLGYEVALARDEASFRARLAECPPDAVVVHTNVRSADWEALIREVRTGTATRAVPVLAFGPHVDLERRRRALEAGATQVVANSKFLADMGTLLARALER